MATPKVKPRASQLKQQRYEINTMSNPVAEELTNGTDWKPARNHSFTFVASEADIYAVLSVAHPGDAAWMLSRGVRTADDAARYLRDHGAEHRIVKRRGIASEALRRNISSHEFMGKMKLAAIGHPDDDSEGNPIDVLELSTITSLADQWGHVAREVRYGAIRLQDIKYLGASKLKSFRRLVSVKEALEVVNDEDAKFAIDDLKYLVDRAARDSLAKDYFDVAVEYLIEEGVEGLKKIDSLKMLRAMATKHEYGTRFKRMTYEIDFRTVYERKLGAKFPEQEVIELFDAGVPAERAAEMINQGVPVRTIIGVVMGGTESAIAEGWL